MGNDTETGRHAPQATAAGQRAHDTKETLAEGGERVKDEAARATAEVRQQGRELASSAVERADRFATEQKEAGAEHVASFARAVDRAAEELERSSPELARYAHQAASTADRISDTLRQRSVRDLLDDANDFARREPALFFGTAVMAGMVLSRFLRSTQDPDAEARHADDGRSASRTTISGRH